MEDRDVILTRIATRLTAVVASTAPDEPPDWWITHIDTIQITAGVHEDRMTVAKAKFLRLIRWRAFYAEVLLGECSR
jgi:hypothetical protein